jgi:hypothetical protein
MAKKDFTQVDNVIAQATVEQGKRKPRKEYTEQEAAEIAETMHTTGKKGVKLPRINLAFSPSNYEYIQIMSRVRGENLTQFINKIIAEHKEQHMDIYEKAQEFIDSL